MSDDEKNTTNTFRQDATLIKEELADWRNKPAQDPFLVILSGAEKGKKVLLVAACTILGRSVQANIQVKDPRASRQHAQIEKSGSGFVIRDLGSINGTWVNGHQITGSFALSTGDHIVIGSTEFLLTIPPRKK